MFEGVGAQFDDDEFGVDLQIFGAAGEESTTLMLDDEFKVTQVFYTIPETRNPGEIARGDALMPAYGLTPYRHVDRVPA